MAELEDMRSFVEVVESGGLNRAAARLGISKSILSRRITRLEADLDEAPQVLQLGHRGVPLQTTAWCRIWTFCGIG